MTFPTDLHGTLTVTDNLTRLKQFRDILTQMLKPTNNPEDIGLTFDQNHYRDYQSFVAMINHPANYYQKTSTIYIAGHTPWEFDRAYKDLILGKLTDMSELEFRICTQEEHLLFDIVETNPAWHTLYSEHAEVYTDPYRHIQLSNVSRVDHTFDQNTLSSYGFDTKRVI